MKYYSRNVYDEDHPNLGYVETNSEKEILDEYWTYWYGKMCEKFGKAFVDDNYSTEDCIDDWCVVNLAWVVTDE